MYNTFIAHINITHTDSTLLW